MKKIKFYTLFIISVFVCACTSTYLEPQTKDIARLQLDNDSNSFLYLTVFKDSQTCTGWLRPNISGTNEENLKQHQSTSINIESYKVFTLFVDGRSRKNGLIEACSIAGTFLPIRNKYYIAKFSSENQECHLSMVRLEDKNGKTNEVSDESFKQREIVAGITNNGSICK